MSKSGPTDRILEAYYAEVRNTPFFNFEEEQALFREYRSCTSCPYRFQVGESAAKCPRCSTKRNFKPRDMLVKSALRFALKEAKKYAVAAKGHRHDPEILKNLISAANWGLLIAADRHDPARGTKFLTYAANWVKERIRDELDRTNTVRVPVYKQKDLRRKRKTGENTEDDLGHVKMEELGEVDQRQKDEKLERELINSYGADLIHESLNALRLRGRDKYIILAYFGVKEEPKSMKQLAGRLELSTERIRQIKEKAMLRLKKYLDRKKVDSTDDLFTA